MRIRKGVRGLDGASQERANQKGRAKLTMPCKRAFLMVGAAFIGLSGPSGAYGQTLRVGLSGSVLNNIETVQPDMALAENSSVYNALLTGSRANNDLGRSSSVDLIDSTEQIILASLQTGDETNASGSTGNPVPVFRKNDTNSDELRNREINRRNRQNRIDEPRLEPMFGPDNDDEAFDELQSNAEAHEEEFSPRVETLSGFTSILTLLTPEDTQLSLGIGPVLRPDYFGSDNYEFEADPQVFIQIGNFSFFDDDGADLALFGFSGFRFGPSLRLAGDRDENDNPELTGLDPVGFTFELGGFVSTTFLDRYSFKFKVRRGIDTGHRGVIVDAFGTALLFRYGPFSTSLSAQTSWIGGNYADAFFSVSETESIASGLSQFNARSGFRNIGGSINGYLNLGNRWSINPYFQYDYVIGNIVNSPLIAEIGSRSQARAGFHVIRQFKIF